MPITARTIATVPPWGAANRRLQPEARVTKVFTSARRKDATATMRSSIAQHEQGARPNEQPRRRTSPERMAPTSQSRTSSKSHRAPNQSKQSRHLRVPRQHLPEDTSPRLMKHQTRLTPKKTAEGSTQGGTYIQTSRISSAMSQPHLGASIYPPKLNVENRNTSQHQQILTIYARVTSRTNFTRQRRTR